MGLETLPPSVRGAALRETSLLADGALDLPLSRPKDSRRAPRKPLSPILDQIINGGPSSSLNVSRITRSLHGGVPMFANRALNRCILFKYPNFQVELEDGTTFDFSGQDSQLSGERPVETAIYIPNDEEAPEDGGFAIYMRQKGAEELLTRCLGVTEEIHPEAVEHDIEILQMIDDIPSLDPFLLKTTCERDKIDIDPAYLALAHGEEKAIKRVIGDRVRPIVTKALGSDAEAHHEDRLIKAIWDPTIPDATVFIEALKIDGNEVERVFGAWKGVSFYQNQFSEMRGRIALLMKWFKSPQSIPIDIQQNKHFAEQQVMYKLAVIDKLKNIIRKVQQILQDLDDCYASFVEDGDPIPLRTFLITSHTRYWILGFCCTALSHCCSLFDRQFGRRGHGRLNFQQINEMLTHMDATLQSKNDLEYLA